MAGIRNAQAGTQILATKCGNSSLPDVHKVAYDQIGSLFHEAWNLYRQRSRLSTRSLPQAGQHGAILQPAYAYSKLATHAT